MKEMENVGQRESARTKMIRMKMSGRRIDFFYSLLVVAKRIFENGNQQQQNS